jgi:hypothetical protein
MMATRADIVDASAKSLPRAQKKRADIFTRALEYLLG